MPPVPNGTYSIITRKDEPTDETYATELTHTPGSTVNLVRKIEVGHEGEQQWIVENTTDGNATIKNKRSGLYLSYKGKPEDGLQAETLPEKREWRIQQAAEPHVFHIVVPGGPVGKHELAYGVSLRLMDPPLTALRNLDVKDETQAWKFEQRH